MSSPLPDGMMRTSDGSRITVRPSTFADDSPGIVLAVQGICGLLTTDESHELRDLLQAAELRAARGDVIT